MLCRKSESGGTRRRPGRERCLPYHLCGNAHLVEFLLVVRARFGAVVCDEDNLLPCGPVSTIYQPLGPVASNNTIKLPLLRSISRVSTVPSNRWSPDHSTPMLLLVSSASGHRAASMMTWPIAVAAFFRVGATWIGGKRGWVRYYTPSQSNRKTCLIISFHVSLKHIKGTQRHGEERIALHW